MIPEDSILGYRRLALAVIQQARDEVYSGRCPLSFHDKRLVRTNMPRRLSYLEAVRLLTDGNVWLRLSGLDNEAVFEIVEDWLAKKFGMERVPEILMHARSGYFEDHVPEWYIDLRHTEPK